MSVHATIHTTHPVSTAHTSSAECLFTLFYIGVFGTTLTLKRTQRVFSNIHRASVDAVRGKFLTGQFLTCLDTQPHSVVTTRAGKLLTDHVTFRLIVYGVVLVLCVSAGGHHRLWQSSPSCWVHQARRLLVPLLLSPSFSIPPSPLYNSGRTQPSGYWSTPDITPDQPRDPVHLSCS